MGDKVFDKIKELYQSGLDSYDRGDYDQARIDLREVDALNPRMADVLNRLGIIANMGGNLHEAVEYFQRAVALNPNYTEAALNLTITYNEMGETDRAYEIFHRISSSEGVLQGKLDPFAAGKLANEHFRVGNIYLQFNLQDEAIEEYRKALNLKGDLPDVLTKLGSAQREKGQMEEAVANLERAIEINPYYGTASVELGLAYYSLGRRKEACDVWEAALKLDPELKGAKTLFKLYRPEE